MTVTSREEAKARDNADPLRAMGKLFELPKGVIYLDGNSLGPPPRGVHTRLRRAVEKEWAGDLIKSWNDADWINLPITCGRKIAKIIGADDDEVLVCDSVSVNIFKIASALLKTHPGALGYEDDEFPTDGYILEGLSAITGAPLQCLAPGAAEQAFTSGVRVLVKSAVHYKTGEAADIAAWEKEAGNAGAAIIWDLSHAAGVISLALKARGARYAVGCGYKFLNGGPGAPAYLFIHQDAAETLMQPLCGWMGHASPFDFSRGYRPAKGVKRFACGTPPVLSLSALDAALDIFESIDIADLERKARALGDLFVDQTKDLGLRLLSPVSGPARGAHVSLCHEHGYEIVQALIEHGVIGDFRAPDIMRFGFSPAFLTYENIWDAAGIFRGVMQSGEWRDPRFTVRKHVT